MRKILPLTLITRNIKIKPHASLQNKVNKEKLKGKIQ